MVEGHSVHRIASRFRQRLVGKRFRASSPNGRFNEGSAAIDGRVMSNMEAVGKNLFAFFSSPGKDDVVVHVHFGMSGAWSLHAFNKEPEVKTTTRLRLEELDISDRPGQSTSTSNGGVVAHLSAMTCNFGGPSLFTTKRATLGHDPLRSDADPDALYEKIQKSKKTIGQLVMDQSYFCGPGNIYRAEILFLAGVHPDVMGAALDRASFDRVWKWSVSLLRRGYDTGSILTVDATVDRDAASRGERRYIYNRSNCARCGGRVRSWDVSGRTCYACESGCQPRPQKLDDGTARDAKRKQVKKELISQSNPNESPPQVKEVGSADQYVPFISSCARDGYKKRLEQHGPSGLTIAEIRSCLETMLGSGATLPPKGARKAVHVAALTVALSKDEKVCTSAVVSISPLPMPKVSAEEAVREKAAAGEHRGVEHVAELSSGQAVEAIRSTPLLVQENARSETKSGGRRKVARARNSESCAGTKRKAMGKQTVPKRRSERLFLKSG